ncbi:MAG: Asp-tRNA(Asn)/Glu-tRNA(Gln) amidotransferase subunit GatB [Gaiellaceae bacterium]
MPEWEPVIGLEIHVQLKTRTKMFCRCESGFGADPNTRTCPICLGHPGTLPVPNAAAVEWTVKLGLALGCEIAGHALFHRKHYSYPDLAKGYQISQYDVPLCANGRFLVPGPDGDREIGIVRAHLEEDAAKNVHVGGAGGRIGGAAHTLVDYNRGGTPLVEIVTQPDLRSADEAKRFLQLLRQTIVELGISDAEMEKGTLRADANVSVRPRGADELRTRTELKNMNSFSFIARGINAEVARQIEVWESGDEVVQQTYDYHPETDALTVRRTKEEAEDYRYLPDPDLVPIEPPAELVERLRGDLPEAPGARIRRLEAELDHELAQDLVVSGRDRLYERTPGDRRAVANVVMNQLAGAARRPRGGRRRGAGQARRGARQDPPRCLRRGARARRRPRLPGRALPRRGGRGGRGGAGPDRRRGARRPSRRGRRVPRRQAGAARLLRRPGDEADAGEGGRQGRQRARPREAGRIIRLCSSRRCSRPSPSPVRRHRCTTGGTARRRPTPRRG